MCVLIGLQVCFHSAMKHENDAEQYGCLSPSCENLQFNEGKLSAHTHFVYSLSLC